MTEIQQLIEVPEEKRDTQWENLFFHNLVQSPLDLVSEEPQIGPDGFPYLLTQTSDRATEPASKIIQWLATKGIGLVVNPMKEYPDYVFTYGMIWHFKETGWFYRTAENRPTGTVEIHVNDRFHYGEPSSEYLPSYVRQILREFFRDQGLFAPKILMLSQEGKNFDLAVSLESLGNPPQAEHQGIAEALSWFLPPHYSLLLVSEKGLPHFFEL